MTNISGVTTEFIGKTRSVTQTIRFPENWERKRSVVNTKFNGSQHTKLEIVRSEI